MTLYIYKRLDMIRTYNEIIVKKIDNTHLTELSEVIELTEL